MLHDIYFMKKFMLIFIRFIPRWWHIYSTSLWKNGEICDEIIIIMILSYVEMASYSHITKYVGVMRVGWSWRIYSPVNLTILGSDYSLSPFRL